MKKFIAILFLLSFTTPCFSAGVGYINYEKVAHSYTFAKNSIQEVEMKGREIENYLKIKEAEFNNQDLFENGSNEIGSIVMFNEDMIRQGKIKDCYQKSYWKAAFLVLLKNSQEFKHLIGSISK